MDKVDQAIGSVQAAARERRLQVRHVMVTGRVAVLDVPMGMTLDEFRSLIGYVAADFPREMAQAAASEPPPSGLVVARGSIPKNGN